MNPEEKIQIIYEDENVLIINKPSGLITHPKDINDAQSSVTEWVVKNYPQIAGVGEDSLRPGLVHRLDKDTSGLLLITKNQEAFLFYKDLFKSKKIKKYYLALVIGRPKYPKGTIDSPLGRVGMKRTTQPKRGKLVDEKSARTDYKTIENLKDYTLLEVSPKTGRTHQIRVHLKSIGIPVAGDPLYGFKNQKNPEGLARLFLHAYKLEFSTQDGKRMTLEADLPEELQEVVASLPKK